MRQFAFEFMRELEYIIRFPPKVEKQLLRQMAKVIWYISQTEGGTNNERLTDKQQNYR
jgi:hypothetical protein